MTWVMPPLWSETRPAEDIRCGIESGAEVVYAEAREAEEAADRRHDHSDHLGPYCEEYEAWLEARAIRADKDADYALRPTWRDGMESER